MSMRLSRFLAIALLGATSISCSRVKLAYKWLDWVLAYQTDRFLQLDDAQEAAAELAIDELLAWHRREMLPRHAAFLRRVARDQRQDTFDTQAFDMAWRDLRTMIDDTAARMAPPVATLLVSQRPSQLGHLETRLTKRHAELRDENERPNDEQRHERIENTIETIEDLVGELSSAQRLQIEARLAGGGQNRDLWLHERARRNAVLLTKLRRGASRAEIESFLRAWWTGTLESPNRAYERYRQRHNTNLEGMLRDLFVSLTPAQRQTFADNLDEYAEAFEDLAADVRSAAPERSG